MWESPIKKTIRRNLERKLRKKDDPRLLLTYEDLYRDNKLL